MLGQRLATNVEEAVFLILENAVSDNLSPDAIAVEFSARTKRIAKKNSEEDMEEA
jgi:hypothetical protein